MRTILVPLTSPQGEKERKDRVFASFHATPELCHEVAHVTLSAVNRRRALFSIDPSNLLRSVMATMLRRQVIALLIGCCVVADPGMGSASPGFGSNLEVRASAGVQRRDGPFHAPAKLRGRVDFWKDVFAKYGKNQVVVHHREFPQVIFGVMDFTDEARSLTPVQLKHHRDTIERDTIHGIRRQLEPLAKGNSPETPFQYKVAKLMAFLPSGTNKYKRLIDEADLIRTQTGIRERYAEAVQRAWRYLPVMEQIFVSEYGLPKELTRLPFIESSFDYTAYSSVGAAGIWQFMPRTARSHGMVVGRIVDERRDPIRATRGAAEYLRSAFNSLGNWPSAVTSYNHGVGGVRSKLNKAGTTVLAEVIEDPNERYFGFASTNFWPEFLAANEIFDDYQRYFPELELAPPLRVVSHRLKGATSAAYVARQLGISMTELQEANYALLEPVWRGSARIPSGYLLRVPVQYQDRLVRLGVAEPAGATIITASSAVYGGVAYTVRKGDTLFSIAKKYKTTKEALMQMNGLSQSAVKVGQVLTVREKGAGARTTLPVSSSQRAPVVKPSSATSTKVKSSPPNKAASRYTVKKGDTLSAISKKTGRSIEAIKRANKIKGSNVTAGRSLVIP